MNTKDDGTPLGENPPIDTCVNPGHTSTTITECETRCGACGLLMDDNDPRLTDGIYAIQRGAVLGILSSADKITATTQLAERQGQAIAQIRAMHQLHYRQCCVCCQAWPCATIRAINQAGA